VRVLQKQILELVAKQQRLSLALIGQHADLAYSRTAA
jgi:hypothetical protein